MLASLQIIGVIVGYYVGWRMVEDVWGKDCAAAQFIAKAGLVIVPLLVVSMLGVGGDAGP